MKYRKSFAMLLCVLSLTVAAQQIGTWHMYLSYQVATKSDVSGSTIYSLMNGNLLSYDTGDGEVRTYDHMDVLSDVNISHISYSKEAKRLLVVYSNSNIDLLDDEGNILNLSALKDKRILGKEVMDICVCGSTAFVATEFGIVEIDMKEGVFRNTYKLSFNINSIGASDECVFIGTPDCIRYCSRKSNMHLEENWNIFQDWGGMKSFTFFQGKLIGLNPNGIYVLDPSVPFSLKTLIRGSFTFVKNAGSRLLWGDKTKIGYTTDVSAEDATTLAATATLIPYDNIWNDVSYIGGTYWVSEQENGLRGYKIDGENIVPTGEVIQPSSPIRDLGYKVNWVGNRLLVAGGINTYTSYSYPATAMYYENGEWTNFKEMDIPAKYPKFQLTNTTDLVQDPLDATHHFASLSRGGLCEYKNGVFVKHYTDENSPLRSIIPDLSQYYNYFSCAALSYDGDGNLWMASVLTDSVLHVLKPNGKWFNLQYKEFSGVSLIDQILHHSSGLKLLVSRRVAARGIFCLDTKGTERNTDDKIILLQNIVNQDGTPYLPDKFYCLCEDFDGQVWVGTSSGLFVIEDVSQVFNKDFQFTQIKINRNDGSGLADYLLNDVSIACISVDAANRKWIGTQTNGAYLISADGQEMIHHFTTEDSPLLSNNVQGIAINPETGEVVFGTDKGLCSFVGDATAPEEELSKDNVIVFPNPVTPDYNGPIAIRGLVNNAEVKILSSGGQLVWNGSSAGGTCLWNGCANNGNRVASGIYHVVANTAEGKKAIITRIVIVN